jgi:hypothetical protein
LTQPSSKTRLPWMLFASAGCRVEADGRIERCNGDGACAGSLFHIDSR